ncbi:MAG: C4-dicarboxylate ABC transporter substrate-binding protein, partial [Methylibium sp.]|nr:C4-dicarboxylate ABC transporter substrate-binding protein [Methylibium sp.]
MPRLPKFRDTLINTRDLLVTGGPFVLIALALLVLAYWALDPTPPKKVTLATGPEQGAYAEFGQRYKAHLQRFGIEVELRPTQGSSENLKLLQDPESNVDFAFVQGGAGRLRRNDEGPPPDLVSLGSLFYEPVWLFYREAAAKEKLGSEQLESLAQLKGWR